MSIMRVDIHSELNGWQTVVDNSPLGIKYDLLELVDNVALIGVTELDAGLYTQIRLILGTDNTIVVGAGDKASSLPLTIPGGEKTGIKLTGEFEVKEGEPLSIILDFDTEKSIHMTGSVKYMFKPTIRILEETDDNQPPYPVIGPFTSINYYEGTGDKTFQLEIAEQGGLKDPDGDTVYFRSSLLPSWITLDENTGMVTVDITLIHAAEEISFWSEDEHDESQSEGPFIVEITVKVFT